jgi:purine-binding chemotaxis protein CheW
MQYLTFKLNSVEYAVDVNIVETVVEYCATTAVPSPVEYMKGVIYLRGRIVPVIDLRRKFGLPESGDQSLASIIVFTVEADDKKQVTVAAIVDEVSEVVTIEEGAIQAAQAEGVALWERYVHGIVRLEDRMIVIIAAGGLFSIREIEALRAA